MNNDLKPTTFYVRWPGTKDEDFIVETNQLGQITYPLRQLQNSKVTRRHLFTKFAGYIIMEEFIRKNRMDILEASEIISSSGRKYNFEQFLDSIENVEMR